MVVVVIPAWRPGAELVDIVASLQTAGLAVVVVDDGSGRAFRPVFDRLSSIVVCHSSNRGKGAALKTGIRIARWVFPGLEGVVTADADGQHDPADVVRVARCFAAAPDALVLGARRFDGDEVPLRSRIGNGLTRRGLRLATGLRLSDTQTGLRAIPCALLPGLLRIRAQRYEFELAMLVAVRKAGVEIVELPIRTIYERGNPSSHFHPVWDSMQVLSVLLR